MLWHMLVLAVAVAAPTVRAAEPHIRDFMTPAQFRAAGLQKLSAAEIRALDRWFAATCGVLPAAELVVPSADFSELLGSSLIGGDGTFLGKISRSTIDPDSISNTMSEHGSTLGSPSIFNTLGEFGSSLSDLSPFNSLAGSPPRIVKNGQQLGYLTKNSLKQPAVDPNELLRWLNPRRSER